MDFGEFDKGPESLRSYIVERLQGRPVDFLEQMQAIREKRQRGERTTSSGVLLPLEQGGSDGELAVILNKRSDYVQQAGDLCLPGGGTDRRLDRVLSRLLSWGILPTKRSEPFRRLLRSPPREREIFLFILASVLRESWEEMRLPPWKVEYLGSLPTLGMHSFPRVIFPVVGTVRAGWKVRPNWEVETVLRVPLRAFFDPANYGLCEFVVTAPREEGGGPLHWEYPCLVIGALGGEEILWGATFRILMNFMERVFGLSLEGMKPPRRIAKTLSPYYFSGKGRKGIRRRGAAPTSGSRPKPE